MNFGELLDYLVVVLRAALFHWEISKERTQQEHETWVLFSLCQPDLLSEVGLGCFPVPLINRPTKNNFQEKVFTVLCVFRKLIITVGSHNRGRGQWTLVTSSLSVSFRTVQDPSPGNGAAHGGWVSFHLSLQNQDYP